MLPKRTAGAKPPDCGAFVLAVCGDGLVDG